MLTKNGGKAARYFATDMCDGMGQGHDGINYSPGPQGRHLNLGGGAGPTPLPLTGACFIASCDKGHARHADEHWTPKGNRARSW